MLFTICANQKLISKLRSDKIKHFFHILKIKNPLIL